MGSCVNPMMQGYWAVKVVYRERMPQTVVSLLHNLKTLQCTKGIYHNVIFFMDICIWVFGTNKKIYPRYSLTNTRINI